MPLYNLTTTSVLIPKSQQLYNSSKFVAERLNQMQSDTPNCSQQPELNVQLNAYMDSLETSRSNSSPALHYWQQQTVQQTSCICTGPAVSTASQAYVEQIFSVCGLLTSWSRNHMSNSLEMRVTETEQHRTCS